MTVEDNRGNKVVYRLQRGPAASLHTGISFYREFLLDSDNGLYVWNLFADLSTVPDFIPVGATIRAIVFEIDEHGTATFDDLVIADDASVDPNGDLSGVIGDKPCSSDETGCDDNCPSLPNPDQADQDGDGLGDACDPTPMPELGGLAARLAALCALALVSARTRRSKPHRTVLVAEIPRVE